MSRRRRADIDSPRRSTAPGLHLEEVRLSVEFVGEAAKQELRHEVLALRLALVESAEIAGFGHLDEGGGERACEESLGYVAELPHRATVSIAICARTHGFRRVGSVL